MKQLLLALSIIAVGTVSAQDKSAMSVDVTLHDGQTAGFIPKEIYGQFAEELGTCISDGLWVGRDSSIPNTDGYRNDVLEALKNLKVPVLRWPGGCFADTYHWRDGIGKNRKSIINIHWGDNVVDNAFGTHEFLNLCELLGTQPYISMNVGSAGPEESLEWMEYMTAKEGPMADLRKQNGREKPWKVKYVGIGNESWGCGGNMTAEYYSDLYRRYQSYVRSYGGNEVYRVASGANADDYNWTKVLMQKVGGYAQGLSLHYYSVLDWANHGSATKFTTEDYYRTLAASVKVEELLQKHIAIMDEYDPQKRIGLLLDEWGTWWDDEKSVEGGCLCQQNTMRDAIVAALELDIFHKYTDRLKMCNIAQVVNVLQSMIITDGPKMTLTPTYHVFRLYNVHQDATRLATETNSQTKSVEFGGVEWLVPEVDVTASRDNAGTVHLSLTNTNPTREAKISLNVDEMKAKECTGEVLASAHLNDHNTFDKPTTVQPRELKGIKVKGKQITFTLPAASVATLTIK